MREEGVHYYCISCGRGFTTYHSDVPIACPWCAETTLDGEHILQEEE